MAIFFETFAKICNEQPEQVAMGCLIVNSIVEIGRADPQVEARADRYKQRIHGAFRSALERAAEEGFVEGDLEARADLAYMMLMGLRFERRSTPRGDQPTVCRRHPHGRVLASGD